MLNQYAFLMHDTHAGVLDCCCDRTNWPSSAYTSANYYLNLPVLSSPAFSPAAGSYPGPQTVTISSPVAGAAIYYTTNGTVPTESATKYTGPIAITSSETVSAIAMAGGYSTSAPAVAQYFIGSSNSSFIYTLAGTNSIGYSGDGGLAPSAQINFPFVAVADAAGNLYVSDTGNSVVRKVSASTGVTTTIAGTGTRGYSGDNGPATSAQLEYPTGLAIDNANNLYIADEGSAVVRKLALASGVITTIAGNGTAGTAGSGSPAINAQLDSPTGLAIDSGNLYIADSGSNRVLKVAARVGAFGYGGDGGPATSAYVGQPTAICAGQYREPVYCHARIRSGARDNQEHRNYHDSGR